MGFPARPFQGLAAALLVFTAPAWAARDAAMQDCRADYRRLCASVSPGDGRVAACLAQHEAELTPACRAALGVIAECGQQMRQICGGSASGPGAWHDCAKAHASELSATCRAALPGQ
jgi:hypothetical protein